MVIVPAIIKIDVLAGGGGEVELVEEDDEKEQGIVSVQKQRWEMRVV